MCACHLQGGYQIFGFEEDFGSLAELVQHYQTHGFNRPQRHEGQERQQVQGQGAKEAVVEETGKGAGEGVGGTHTDTGVTPVSTADGKAETEAEGGGGTDGTKAAPETVTQREKRDEEIIGTVLECTHPLRLGDIDEVTKDGVDPAVKRMPKQVTTDRQPSKEEQEKQRLVEKRRVATKFTFVPDEEIPENVEDRLPVSEYLDTNQPMPPWCGVQTWSCVITQCCGSSCIHARALALLLARLHLLLHLVS